MQGNLPVTRDMAPLDRSHRIKGSGSQAAVPKTSNRARVIHLFVGFLAVFIVGDQVLSHMPYIRVYGSRNVCLQKLELYRNDPRPPDVVFLGASYEMCGINPTVVDKVAAIRLHHSIYSLNLAASSSSLLTQSLLARRIAEGQRLPTVLYFGISPPAVDDTLTHWMSDGLRALGRAGDVPRTMHAPTPVLVEGVRTAMLASYAQWEDYRLITRLAVIGAPLNPARRLIIDERGWARWTGGINLPPKVLLTGAESSLDDEALTGNAVAYRDPRGFDLGNVNGVALHECVAKLRGAGVRVRLVEVPHHSTSRPRAHPEKNLPYRHFVEAVTAELGVPLVRPPHGLITDDDFFDEWHLHPDGAEKFSAWLALDVAAALEPGSEARIADDPAKGDVTFASRSPRCTEESRR